MASSGGGGDLLDLTWEQGASGGVSAATPTVDLTAAPTPAAGAAVAPEGAAASPVTVSLAELGGTPAAPAAGADAFGDDDWDAFQSAAPAAALPAPAPAASSAQEGPAPDATAAAAAASPAESATATFDPLLDARPQNTEPELLSSTDLAALGTEANKGGDNLISFGTFHEFDPVQTFEKDQGAPAGQPVPEAAAPVAAPAAPAAPPAAPKQEAATGNSAELFDFSTDGGAALAGQSAGSGATTAPPAPQAGGIQEAASSTAVKGEVYPTAPAAGSSSAAQASSGVSDLLGLGGETPKASEAELNAGEAELNAAMAGELTVPVEDIQKIMIYVYYKGEKNIVGWYADTRPSDIKEAVLCACDAIIDGGFVLREVQFTGDDNAEPTEDGQVFEFEQFDRLQNGQTYIIESAKEREDLKSIVGDRWRRLKVCVDPLMHVEAQKAIERMRRGSNLLKHTHYGFPHLRQFQLSDDKKRLVWYSGAKRKEDSVVMLDELQEIRLGQTTPVFLHYRLPMLEHLSFSLIHGPKGSKTLDLTCKDEFEFDHWLTGLKAVFYHFKNKPISKEALLGHSKRFKKALEKNNVGIKLTKLPEVKEKGHVGLDDCIEIVTHTPKQLDTKMERLRERLRTMSQQVARLDVHAAAEMEVDLSLLAGQGPAYAGVFAQDEDAQDEEMEIRRIHELVEQTTQVLQQARNELTQLNQRAKEQSGSSAENASKGKKKETAACKHIDQLLWKAEVDLENVEDMYFRHVDNQKDTATPFASTVAEVNQRLTRASSDLQDTFSKKLIEIRSWFR